jgi:hypothetical protein
MKEAMLLLNKLIVVVLLLFSIKDIKRPSKGGLYIGRR